MVNHSCAAKTIKPDGNDYGVDGKISNVLSGNRRAILFTREYRSWRECGDDRLMIGMIDAQTGELVGDRTRLAECYECGSVRTIGIDPEARFVLYYIEYFTVRKGLTLEDSIVYQALDATGHPSGKPLALLNSRVASSSMLVEKQ